MRVLGLSALVHDPAAALIGEKGIEAAIEESKLERSRNAAGIPREAVRFCLEQAGVNWRDLEILAVASRPLRAWARRALLRARVTPRAPISSGYYQTKALGELARELNNFRILQAMAAAPTPSVLALDHHLCHAASAFFASPFDRALILTQDEQGDGRAGLVAIGEGTRIRPHRWIQFPHSLAWIYSQVTELLGFQPRREEHKTQWLSLYGQPAFLNLFLEMMRHDRDPYPLLDRQFFTPGYAGRLAFSPSFYRRLGIENHSRGMADETLRANLARSVQQACATVVIDLLKMLRRETGVRFLCLAGGLFLNPILVSAVEESGSFEGVFVQPAAGNEGTALGAAWIAWHTILGQPRGSSMAAPYWGPDFTNDEAKRVLDNCKAPYSWFDSEDRKIAETLKLLGAGKIVAWCQGAAEFGPRALGNRSLLASPWAEYVQENLNDYVKHRESFRPFALSVTAEDCGDYFFCSPAARFMATLGRVRPGFRERIARFLLPGDRVRLHIVESSSNPALWKLLKRFSETAPAPVLVNTSFNLFGEPLVITPRDAVRSYFCSGIDALVLGNFLLRKT